MIFFSKKFQFLNFWSFYRISSSRPINFATVAIARPGGLISSVYKIILLLILFALQLHSYSGSIYLLIQMDQPKRLLCWMFMTSDNFNWDYSEIVCIISNRIWLANIMYSLCCLTRISRECERQRIHSTNAKHVPHPNGRIHSHLHAICC